ncbi:MAG: C10 family peptidase [Bacteroidales bacterium]|nr:C10 family peptidase [Bacteroidales bacterium]
MKHFPNFWLLLILLAGVFITGMTGCAKSDVQDPGHSGFDSAQPQHLSISEAESLAMTFLQGDGSGSSLLRASAEDEPLTLAFQDPRTGLRASTDDEESGLPAYYVFNIGDKGFVVVSAWDNTLPILGYSDEGPFMTEEDRVAYPAEASNVLSFLGAYSGSIESLRRTATIDEELVRTREAALRGAVSTRQTRAYNSIAPLLGNIEWNQSPYYNAYCPTGTPVGCVATATCQIMKYWEYPDYGRGSHRSSYDGQVANYEHALNWRNMPAATLRTWNNDVAQFCYDVAVGLNMMFGRSGSGTWQSYVPDLLVDHYYYKNTAQDLFRERYTTAQWENIVYNELANGRPVQYAGAGSGGGHSFVCDGYRNGYFHINWGWGGMSNGYFLLHALDPNSLGTGGGSGGFNYGQDIVVGIQPATQPNPVPDPDPTPDPGDPSGSDYCVSSGRYANSTFISRVTISNVDQRSGTGEGGYNYYGSPAIKLTKGKTYTLTVVPGSTAGNYPEYWRVWIDVNGDKQFSSDELATEFTTTVANRAVSKSIRIPLNTTSRETRMRVSMKWGSYPSACETFDHGEVEDYAVLFGTSDPTPDPTPDPDPVVPDPDPVVPTPEDIDYPSSSAVDSYWGFIHTVQIGSMENRSVKGDNYADYSRSSERYIHASSGRSLTYKLTPGFGSPQMYWCYWRVWIDFNKNGIFESSEMKVSKYGSQYVSGWFSLPFNLDKGFYRVRVSMCMNDGYPSADRNFDYGEVEDYSLYIE